MLVLNRKFTVNYDIMHGIIVYTYEMPIQYCSIGTVIFYFIHHVTKHLRLVPGAAINCHDFGVSVLYISS